MAWESILNIYVFFSYKNYLLDKAYSKFFFLFIEFLFFSKKIQNDVSKKFLRIKKDSGLTLYGAGIELTGSRGDFPTEKIMSNTSADKMKEIEATNLQIIEEVKLEEWSSFRFILCTAAVIIVGIVFYCIFTRDTFYDLSPFSSPVNNSPPSSGYYISPPTITPPTSPMAGDVITLPPSEVQDMANQGNNDNP